VGTSAPEVASAPGCIFKRLLLEDDAILVDFRFFFHAPPSQWGGVDLDSRNSGCARLGGEVGPPLGFYFIIIFFSIFSLGHRDPHVQRRVNPFKQQPTFSPSGRDLSALFGSEKPSTGALALSLSRHSPSYRHLSATSLRLYSNPPLCLGSFLPLNSEGGQLNPPPSPGRAAFQPPAWYALELMWNPQRGCLAHYRVSLPCYG